MPNLTFNYGPGAHHARVSDVSKCCSLRRLGVFGHGQVAGIGQALQQTSDLRYYLARNEQAMVHTATAFAESCTYCVHLVCRAGRHHIITGATDRDDYRSLLRVTQRRTCTAATRVSQDTSVNDAFKPVLLLGLHKSSRPATRVLTSPVKRARSLSRCPAGCTS